MLELQVQGWEGTDQFSSGGFGMLISAVMVSATEQPGVSLDLDAGLGRLGSSEEGVNTYWGAPGPSCYQLPY